jgi:Uma2 family endonuclease
MASATQIRVSEYLDTTFRPDREYIDGEVRERNVGKWEHARIQWLLAGWFLSHELNWNVIGSTEQRVQVSPTRIRIPDLVILRPGPQPDILTQPPLLVSEILSPDDSYSDLQERCQDYWQMGVGTVWIVDPKTRSGRMCCANEWVGAERLEVAGTPIHVHLDALFAQIDGQAAPQTVSEP